MHEKMHNCTEQLIRIFIKIILVPRAHHPSGLRQGSRALARPTVGRTRFSENAQSIRFVFSANQICQI